MSAAIIYLAIIFSHQILGDIHYLYGVSNATEVQRQNGVTYVSVRRRIVDLSADWAKRFGDWLLVEVFSDNSIRVTGHGAALSLNI